MEYISYLAVKSFLWMSKFVPNFLLRWIEQLLYFLLNHALKYRKQVIQKNLKLVFPFLNSAQIADITHRQYRAIVRYTVEGLIGFEMKSESLLNKIKFENLEEFRQFHAIHPKIILLAAHYGNWEWYATVLPAVLQKNVIGFYKKINNPKIDKLIREKRGRLGLEMVPHHEAARRFAQPKFDSEIYLLIADQSPPKGSIAIQSDFLHVPTLFQVGPQKLSRKYAYPCVYLACTPLEEGYSIRFHMIPTDADPLQSYVVLLQTQIETDPAYWLWSHKRWKHSLNY